MGDRSAAAWRRGLRRSAAIKLLNLQLYPQRRKLMVGAVLKLQMADLGPCRTALAASC
jgi:hypothetical protein